MFDRTLGRARVMLLGASALSFAASAGDFPQWRGPLRSGVVPQSGPLDVAWPAEGPRLAWRSERLEGGGYGSVVVADGRAYVFWNRRYQVPLTGRTLDDEGFRRVGGYEERPPDALIALVEKVRLGEEIGKLDDNARNAWIDRWLEQNIPDGDARGKFGPWAADRLRRGKGALPMEALARLAAVRNLKFASPEALDAWLVENAIDGDVKKKVIEAIPASISRGADVIVCAGAADGKVVWKKEYQPGADQGDASSTPCIVDGKCYVAGLDGDVYCLDAETGAEVWKAKAAPEGGVVHSSVVVGEGVAVVLAGRLTGMDARTGAILWRQAKVSGRENSPVLWKSGEKTFVVCNTENEVACVELATGNLLWQVPGGGRSTAAIDGSLLVVQSPNPEIALAAYRLSETAPEKLWFVRGCCDGAASPLVHEGCVFAVTARKVVCVEAATGKVRWEEKLKGEGHTSPVLADGKILVVVDRKLLAIRATPAKYELLSQASLPISQFASPAVAGGRLFVRLNDGIGCYDIGGR